MIRVVRVALVAIGVVAGLYGARRLWDTQRPEQVVGVGKWLVGGVVLHDAAIAIAVLLAGVLVVRLVPRAAKAPVTVGAIVLGSVTLAAVPVLLSYGRKPDNPTLLDRDFGRGWLVLAATVVVAVAVAVLVRVRPGPDRAVDPGHGAGADTGQDEG